MSTSLRDRSRPVTALLARAVSAGLDNLAVPSPYTDYSRRTPGDGGHPVASVVAYRAGTSDRDPDAAHAMPVVGSTPTGPTVARRTACGRRTGWLRLGGDWRELPAHEQCRACAEAVAS